MVGYVIGVGMFGLPFLFSRAGVLSFFIFLAVLGPIQYFLHLVYANLIIVTKTYHRMTGYAEIYLGKKGKYFVFTAKMIGNMGALLAYIILSGTYLYHLLSPSLGGSEFFYASVLFFLEAIIVFFGIGMIARVEFFITGLLLVVIVMIAAKGGGSISMANYSLANWHYFLLPYGAMLFAIDGSGSLPIVAKLLGRDKEQIKSVIRVGMILSIAVVIVFTLVILGVSGPLTTEDALTGVGRILDGRVTMIALFFGVLTMATSFFGVAESIRETLWWDIKFNKYLAWGMAVFIPYLLYLIGFQDFIGVISFAGAISGSLCAIFMIIIFLKFVKKKDHLPLFKHKPKAILLYFLILMFVSGLIYNLLI